MKARTISSAAVLVLALGGCDKLQGLIGETKTDPAPAKAEDKAAVATKTDPAAAKAEPTAKAEPAAEAKAEPAAEAKAEPAPTEAAAAPTEAAPADQPCIVGRWKGIDYMAEIRRAIHRDATLRSMKHSSSGGLFGYQVDPATDGKGVVKAKAEELRHSFSGKVQGYKVALTVTLNGETEADYELVGDDIIKVSKPKKNTMKAKGVAKVEGLGAYGKSPKVDPDFDGTFVYECDDKKLKVWRDKKEGEPLDFERE
ncbi:MAG TPA: hypothetical protein VG755_26285 [Nannocystaceae bacterium]|nr:hypothetical protein [Nannocystaceae bacterium]